MDEQGDKALNPEWLQDFLRKSYFVPCSTHHSGKNELRKYCVNCNMSVCKFCVSETHQQHKTLKVYRHVYQNAVSLSAMGNHIDCSQIQPYKCNKSLVIALEPLHHYTKGSVAISCGICFRKLVDHTSYRYCSISCKVKAVLRKPDDSVPPFIALPQEEKGETADLPKEEKEETADLPKEEKEETEEPPKKRHRRKGIPHRAPFF